MRRITLVVAIIAMTAAAAAGTSEAKTRRAVTQTATATAFFFGPGPASLGLQSYDVDLTVTGTETATTAASGNHSSREWFDQFTLFDRLSHAPLLSCSAAGPLPKNGFTVSDDLQLAVLDASASRMEPAGDSKTGFDDAAICPTLSLRVLMAWHATSAAKIDAFDDACEAGHRTITVDATAVGITLNSPLSVTPSAIQQGPSVSGSISRTVGTLKRC